MEISISTGFFYRKTLDSILDIISKTDCENIELCLNQAAIGLDFDTIMSEVTNRGLSIKSIHGPFDCFLIQRNETEEFWIQKCIQLAQKAGAGIIVSHVVTSEDGCNIDEQNQRNIIKFGDQQDIIVTAENLPPLKQPSYLNSLDQIHDFLRENRRYLTLDTSHLAAMDYSLIDSYLLLKEFVANIHISDFIDGIEHKILGTGALDLKSFLKMLYKTRYQGILTIEVDFDNMLRNDLKSNEDALSGLRRSLDLIREYYR